MFFCVILWLIKIESYHAKRREHRAKRETHSPHNRQTPIAIRYAYFNPTISCFKTSDRAEAASRADENAQHTLEYVSPPEADKHFD